MVKKKKWFEKKHKVKYRLALCLVGDWFKASTIPMAPCMQEKEGYHVGSMGPDYAEIADLGEIELDYDKARLMLGIEHKLRLKELFGEWD